MLFLGASIYRCFVVLEYTLTVIATWKPTKLDVEINFLISM